MERKDRWGTARQDIGPSSLTNPWIFRKIGTGGVVSHGPSLRADGTGFYGMWVQDKIFQFDWTTGNTLSTFVAMHFCIATPALGPGNRVYASSYNGYTDRGFMYAIDASIMDYDWFGVTSATGRSDWENASPIVGPEGDAVYGSSNGTIRRYAASDGTILWQRTDRQYMVRTLCFSRDDTKVIVPNGNQVSAINWSNGNLVWNINLGSAAGAAGVAPNGTIVLGSDSGTIYGLNPNTGAILWTWNTISHVRTSPAFSADGTTAYLTGSDSRLYAIRVSDGVRLWSFTGMDQNLAAPSVGHDGTIYFCDRQGRLFAVRPNGTMKWMLPVAEGQSRGPMSIGIDGTLYVPVHGDYNSGLFIIRQIPAQVQPFALAATLQNLFDGDASKLNSSDDQHVLVFDRPEAGGSDLVVTGLSPVATATKLTLRVESSSRRPGSRQLVQAFNYSSGSWTTLDGRVSPTTDLSQTFVLTSNASQWIEPNNRNVRVRFLWLNDNDEAEKGNPFDHRVDEVHWIIEP